MGNHIDLVADFDSKPDSALVNDKTVAALLDVHRNSVWRLVRSGKLPAPVRVAEQTTRWRVGDLRKAIASLKSA
jgi:predicted DNA-binding transcriptional regulator AlpA